MEKYRKIISNILTEYVQDKLLTESSKVDVLINKLDLTKDNAEKMQKICGQLSVMLTNKIKDSIKKNLIESGTQVNEFVINDHTNKAISSNRFNQPLTSIMDYIRVGLNGNISSIKNLVFSEVYKKSHEWHESLDIGQGDINYVETHDIIKDFRDENGEGFYWVDLSTNNSPEECERMGHCGRSSYGNLYSLRSDKKLPGGKYRLNKSHLTAAIGDDGIMYQLKGPKNSKPKDEYHQYILPLFYVLGGGGEEDDYLIRGFGSEYASEMDFKLSDLGNDIIIDLYKNRPELFDKFSLKRKLIDLGIDIPKMETKFRLIIKPDKVGYYVDGDWTVRTRTRKTPAGNEIKDKIGMFETILAGETWDLWDNWDADWKNALDYSVDDKNTEKIWSLVREIAEKNDIELDEDINLEDAIKEVDDNAEITSAISSSVSEAEGQSYVNHLYELLKDNLEEYGNFISMDDSGVVIDIDLDNFIDNVSSSDLDEIIDNCGEHRLECIFDEIMESGYIDKPKFNFDDRWYPDVDENDFNSILSDRLSNI